mmetsp:Transcript_14339/g.20630  ORF Transcript_14339/g.20630 Transcript_14339/m.20630 type:complete len:252 (+) Transcript_14339:134-889(+)
MKMFESYEEGKHQDVLTKLPFSKQSCCNKLTKWIRKYMVGVGEALVTSEQTSIDELRKARSLLSDQVDDPLEEARKIASQAATTKAITHDKQPAENRLKDSDVTNIGEEPAEPSFHLTSVPPPPNFPSKDPKSPVLKPPEGIAPRKKKAWTAEEKNAIKSGIKKLAKGKWADIKEEYSEILADRTSVMIKDCYRTMVASGEIVEEEGIGEEPEEVEKTAEKVVTMSESEFVGAEKRGQKRRLDEQSELHGR